MAPKVPMATAMASSKLLPAAVNASVEDRAYPSPSAFPVNSPMNHITAKYANSGRAIRATSHGRLVTCSPCRANSNTIVNSRPYSAHGPILGRNFSSYQSRPFARSPIRREAKPAIRGMPRKTRTLRAICQTEISSPCESSPSHPGAR